MNIDGVEISIDNLGQDLLQLLVGERWPNGDEGAMRSLASAWSDAATQLDAIRQTASSAAQQVGQYCQGSNADAFASFWSSNFDDGHTSWPSGVAPAALPFAVQFCKSMASALNSGATQIETTKDTILGNIAILVTTVAPQIAAGFLDFGATDATAVGEILADRTAMEVFLDGAKELITEAVEQAIEQGLQQAELNFAIQFKEVLEGHASGINWSEVGQSGLSGAEGGAVGSVVGFGLGKAGGKLLGEDFGKSVAGKMVTGVASGGLTNASLDLLQNGKISASDFTKGSLAGVLGGMGGADAAAADDTPKIDTDNLPTELTTPRMPDPISVPGATDHTDLSGISLTAPDIGTTAPVSNGAAAGADVSNTGARVDLSAGMTIDPSQATAATSSIARILGGGDTQDAGAGLSSSSDFSSSSSTAPSSGIDTSATDARGFTDTSGIGSFGSVGSTGSSDFSAGAATSGDVVSGGMSGRSSDSFSGSGSSISSSDSSIASTDAVPTSARSDFAGTSPSGYTSSDRASGDTATGLSSAGDTSGIPTGDASVGSVASGRPAAEAGFGDGSGQGDAAGLGDAAGFGAAPSARSDAPSIGSADSGASSPEGLPSGRDTGLDTSAGASGAASLGGDRPTGLDASSDAASGAAPLGGDRPTGLDASAGASGAAPLGGDRPSGLDAATPDGASAAASPRVPDSTAVDPTAIDPTAASQVPTRISEGPAPESSTPTVTEGAGTGLASSDAPIDTAPSATDPIGSDPAQSTPAYSSPDMPQQQPDARPEPQSEAVGAIPAQPGPRDASLPRTGEDRSQSTAASASRPVGSDRPSADPNRPAQDGGAGHTEPGDLGGQYPADRQQPAPDPRAENLITAASVPGSGFRGHSETPTTSHVSDVHAEIDPAVRAVVEAHPGLSVDTSRQAEGVYTITDDSGLYGPDQRSFTVRVETQRLGDDTAARSILNHDKGEHVIQISDQISTDHVPRAVAHEIGEIVADRQRYIVDKADAFAPDESNLRPGGPTDDVKLTPHDAGRVQELRVLGEQLDKIPPEGSRTAEQQAQYEATHREAMALVEHLGLRDGLPGAAERRALVLDPSRLTDEGQAHVGKLLADAGGHPDSLSPADRQTLDGIHDQAQVDQAAFDAHRAGLQPDFTRPIADGGGRIEPARLHELADQATANRAQRSQETLDDLRQKAEEAAKNGEYAKVTFQAGGGAALSGRDPGALLVDNRGRWQSDNGDRIAQTADQLRNLRQTGLGDPYQFVGDHDPGARVPLDAVRYWEDDIASQGPVINGTTTLRMEGGKLLADITPADGSPKLTVEVEGTPVIASGFPPEIIPGTARGVSGLHGTFDSTARALDDLGTPDARAAKADLQQLTWRDPASADKARQILADHHIDRASLPKAVNDSLDAVSHWKSLREAHPGQIISGDEANLEGVNPDAAKEWIVAGTGGTGISGVENMLKLSPDAKFTMIGRSAPEGLGKNTQWREVRAQHDLGYDPANPEAASVQNEDGTWPNPTATGRLTMAFKGDMNIGGIEEHTGADGSRFTIAGFEGDGIIASLGTRNSVPPAVADLVDTAMRDDPSSVSGHMLFDDDGQYLGYRIDIAGKSIDVTGAASRFFPSGQLFEPQRGEAGPLPASGGTTDPGTVWSTDDPRYALHPRRAPDAPPAIAAPSGSSRDAPPEGGNFDGGYVATATQASHYAAWRRRGNDPQPIPPAPTVTQAP